MRTAQRQNRGTVKVFDEKKAIAAFLKKFPRKPPAVSREPGDKDLEKAYTELMVAGGRDDGRGMRRAKEKIEFLERLQDNRELLIMALGPPKGPIFSDDFSNSTPWDMTEKAVIRAFRKKFPEPKPVKEPTAIEILFSNIEGPLFPKEFSNATPWAPPEKPKAKKKNAESKQ